MRPNLVLSLVLIAAWDAPRFAGAQTEREEPPPAASPEEEIQEEEPPPMPLLDKDEPPPGPAAAGMAPPAHRAAAGPATRPRHGPNYWLLGVRGGVGVIQQRLTSNEPARELANYDAQAWGASLGVQLAFLRVFGQRFLVGLDGDYTGVSGGAFAFQSQSAIIGETTLSIQSHTISAALNLGARTGAEGGLLVRVRLGSAAQWNLMERSARAPLPSDAIVGALAGIALDAPAFARTGTRPFGFHVSGAFLGGRRQQTDGLSDGQDQVTVGGQGGAALSYAAYRSHRNHTLVLALGYNFWVAASYFAGRAERIKTVTEALRLNAEHDLFAGLQFVH